MNKQEVIELLLDVAQRVFYRTGSRSVHIDKIVELVNQIHEPQKVVVPKYVAEWIEECKASRRSLRDSMKGVSTHPDVNTWLLRNGREMYTYPNQETFARAWLDGYELKEPKYTVEIPNPNFNAPTILQKQGDKTVMVVAKNARWRGWSDSKLTEAEIKQDFEWAWQWAKEVE